MKKWLLGLAPVLLLLGLGSDAKADGLLKWFHKDKSCDTCGAGDCATGNCGASDCGCDGCGKKGLHLWSLLGGGHRGKVEYAVDRSNPWGWHPLIRKCFRCPEKLGPGPEPAVGPVFPVNPYIRSPRDYFMEE